MLRQADRNDKIGIQALHLDSFPKEEAPLIAKLAGELLVEESEPETRTFVIVDGERVIASIAISPMKLPEASGLTAYNLSPLSVLPLHRGKGHARRLVEHCIQWLKEKEVDLFFVYGDPKHYGRYGFEAALAETILPPFPLQFAYGWQAMKLRDCQLPPQPITYQPVAPLNVAAFW